MKKLFVIISSILLISNFSISETFFYPPPEIALDIPDDWLIETENNRLEATPIDESVYFGVWALEDIFSLDSALIAIDIVLSFLLTDIYLSEEVDVDEINNISVYFREGTANYFDGSPVNLLLGLFSPYGKTVFIMLIVGTPEDLETYDEAIDKIVDSIRLP